MVRFPFGAGLGHETRPALRRRGHRILRLGRGAVLVAVLLLVARADAQELPPLPTLHEGALQELEPAVRDMLVKAYDAARATPLDGDSVGQLGMVLHAHRQYDLAVLCYERVQRLQPQSFRWAYYHGLLQAKLGRKERALANLHLAQELNPHHLPVRLALGRTLLAAGRLEDGRRIYESLVRAHPSVAQVHYGLGQVLSASEKFAAAADHYREACRLDPEFGSAHYALAVALRRTGKPREAERHFALYLKYHEQADVLDDPFLQDLQRLQRGTRSHLERGRRLQADGRITEAVQEYEQALAADPERPETHLNLFSAYLTLGQFQRAEEYYRELLRVSPNLPEAHYNYGILLNRQGRVSDAVDAFRKALDVNPHYAEAHNNVGYILFHNGQVEDAAHHFRQAVRSKPRYRLAHYNLATLLLQQGKPNEAIDHLYQTVSGEDEDNPLYLYTLAKACAQAGRLREAIDYAVKAKAHATARGQEELLDRISKTLGQLQRLGEIP